ncbi:hypothetical protein ACF1BE_19995 [Streptomyces sp. NPDC014991]|uniref:hypothetical protein n=1 Tax=Streptomyces sp. NPDC014991 TaxID=3364935 RepID=UPI0036F5FFFE
MTSTHDPKDSRKSIDGERMAAGSLDASMTLNWLREVGASMTGALAAWEHGELVEAPAGRAWDVVRMPRALGWRTVTQMRQHGTPVGPAQHTPDGVEVLVPVGSAASWDLPDTEVLTEGAFIAVPHPAMTAPHTQQGHSWIVSPQDGGPLTDADLLCEAYAAALASTHTEAAPW